jgi:hypothetical protein
LVTHTERGYKLRVFETRVKRKIPGPTRDEVKGRGDNCIMMSLMMCTHVYHDKTNEFGRGI